MSNHWIDSHCHLEMTSHSIPELFLEKGPDRLVQCVTIGTDQSSNQTVLELCQAYPQLYGTLGLHPHEASKADPRTFTFIETEAWNNPKIVAIGECGFDFYYGLSDKTSQRNAFEAQLDIATRLDLPVIIHTREAEKETMEVLTNYKNQNLKGVFHCFTASPELARFALERDFYISFNGIITFPKSETVKTVLKMVPLERILLETDSPYLAPIPHRGKTNSPAFIPLIGAYIADLLNIPVAELAQITTQNTRRLFARMSHED